MCSKKTIKVSIIIVAYKNQNLVEDCLTSIYQFNDIEDSLEVIVVDNSPDDQRLDDSLKLKFPDIKLIKNENFGFGQGNNVGVKESIGKYLFFLNPDTMLIEPLLYYAYNKMERDSSIAILGFQLVDINGKKNHSFFPIISIGVFGTVIYKAMIFLGLYFEPLMFISGANMFMPRDVFYDIGMFDENIFMYGEEQDLTHRIHNIGKKTSFCRSKKIIHLEGGTSGDSEVALRRRIDSVEYYCKKHNKSFKSYLDKEIKTNKHKLYIAKIFKHPNREKFNNTIEVMLQYSARQK